MNVIETHHLTKLYGNKRGISDLNLTVKEGDFFGFIGPNGAGKSTTIRTLLGLINATSGHASLLGMEIGRSRKNILSQIGYLPSEAQFYPGMSVQDILTFSAKLHKKDCSAEASRLCRCLELDPSRKINELSLGNRKKVGIVCAMQHKPRLYIMDEPTSGLDPLMQRTFYSLLQERNKEGATIFLSSHILSEVQKYCRHAAIIKDGHILISDSVENLSTTDAKKIILHGTCTLPELPGIVKGSTTQDSVTFYYNQDMKLLLKSLSEIPFKDITISDPDLDEIFMHYYETEVEK